MTSANEALRDSALSHAIFLAKFGEGLADKVVAILNSADREIVEKLAAGLSTDLGERRLNELLEEIRVLTDRVYSRWDCQDFRVWAGIMGKKETHYVPTQGAVDSG